jgi:hypothetical protein
MRQRPATRLGIALLAAAGLAGCYTVQDSQRFFREAAERDPALELLHQTALYNVYYDHAIRRCVLHSSHTWGERGGGGGGTGLGVTAFACDPARIKARVHQLRFRVEELRDPGQDGNPRRPPELREPYPEGDGEPVPPLPDEKAGRP